ncbi:MAG TPA: hypothetical protein VF185_00425 [Patescibacteria group bacterium]
MEFSLDCNRLKRFINRFHPDTAFGDLERSEQAEVLQDLDLMSATSLAALEGSPEFEKFSKIKISDIYDTYCKEEKEK